MWPYGSADARQWAQLHAHVKHGAKSLVARSGSREHHDQTFAGSGICLAVPNWPTIQPLISVRNGWGHVPSLLVGPVDGLRAARSKLVEVQGRYASTRVI